MNLEKYNFQNIHFQKPEKYLDGYFSKSDNNSIQTPYLKIISISLESYEILCGLNNDDDSKNFFQNIYDIEEFILLTTENNSYEWFNKKIKPNILYENQIKPWIINRNGDIYLKINIEKSVIKEFSNINNEDNLSLTISLKGIKFNSNMFGSVWTCSNYKSFDNNYNIFNNVDDEQEELFKIYDKNNNDNLDKSEQSEQSEKLEQSENLEQLEKLEQSENLEQSEKLEQSENLESKEKLKKSLKKGVKKDVKKCVKKNKKIIYANKVKYISPSNI